MQQCEAEGNAVMNDMNGNMFECHIFTGIHFRLSGKVLCFKSWQQKAFQNIVYMLLVNVCLLEKIMNFYGFLYLKSAAN